jgi:hypothetical protein
MAIVVVGGHSRSVGKTSVAAAIIARLPQMRWTAFKITQFGHGFCTANGEPCDCQTDEHTVAVSEERQPHSGHDGSGTDSARSAILLGALTYRQSRRCHAAIA